MKLYRVMKVAADGKPLLGSGAMMLGVRPRDPALPNKRFDVPAVTAADTVRPGDGGLSCFSDRGAVKITVRPGAMELWSIDSAQLPPALVAVAAGIPHYHVEPQNDVSLDELQQLLADTRDLWAKE